MTAADFHALHQGPEVLRLPNAWDAASARIIESAGAKAIATSSAAVAWAHGFADGHHLPVSKLVATIEEIARVVSAPITADAEGGYADNPADTAQNIVALMRAGAVGINIEDGREPHELHVRKVAAVRAAAEREGVKLFINARTDVWLKQLVAPEAALEEGVRRGKALRDAGADGFFVPMLIDADALATIVREVGLPVNAMARPGLPDAARLQEIGVRRLSAATGVAAAAWAATRAAAEAFLETGDSDVLAQKIGAPFNYNALFLKDG
ncbi:MAG: isocitrate lyase/phosphoenolpyruvate mutase family protein [Hyphomonadaceae bacterium]|nr:isocitrate lyase/phosphoenolpyruvate mutase family protein [Hyphomonadaceae bacterium]